MKNKLRNFEHWGILEEPETPYLDKLLGTDLVSLKVREDLSKLNDYISILERLVFVKTETRSDGKYQIFKDVWGGVWSYERKI